MTKRRWFSGAILSGTDGAPPKAQLTPRLERVPEPDGQRQSTGIHITAPFMGGGRCST